MKAVWHNRSIFFLVGVAFGGNLILSFLFGSFFDTRPFVAYCIQIMIFLAGIITCLYFNPSKAHLENIGFHRVPFLKTFGVVIGLWIFALGIQFLLLTLFGDFYGVQAQDSHLDIFGNSLIEKIGFAFLAICIAPIFEEIIFRGILFPWMTQWLPIPIAIILNGIVFSLLHLEFQSWIAMSLIGALLAFLRYRTQSIYPSIAYHFLNNSIAVCIEIFINH